jgi:hypothetical protein
VRQEYLTGRDYYQQLVQSQFSTEVVIKLFGNSPSDAFADVKQHLMLQLLCSMFSSTQLSLCSAVMFGGHLELKLVEPEQETEEQAAALLSCDVVGCPKLHGNADSYCPNHRAEAAAVLLLATSAVGGEALEISGKPDHLPLGVAGAETLAPYLRVNQTLRSLEISGAKIGSSGMQLLAEALLLDTPLAYLDVSTNDIAYDVENGRRTIRGLTALCTLLKTSR